MGPASQIISPRAGGRATFVATGSSAPFALASAVGAWALYLVLIAARIVLVGYPHALLLVQRHLLTSVAGVALTTLIYLFLRRLERAHVALRIAAASLAAVGPAVLLSIVNYNVLYVFVPDALVPVTGRDAHPDLYVEVVHSVVENYFVLATWSALYTAVSNAKQAQDALRRAAASEVAAREAELRALRHQLDPHFLFNALNTVSGLVLGGDSAGADRTIDALSSFLRATLELNASDDIDLADEMRMQHLYLQVEEVRFGDRLRVDVATPDALAEAQVPALILQPLVENSLRHALARSVAPVRLSISARALDGVLHLTVEDDGPPGSAAGGHGLGLANVASRLALRFGASGRCGHGPRPGGGHRTEVVLPLRYAAPRRGGA